LRRYWLTILLSLLPLLVFGQDVPSAPSDPDPVAGLEEKVKPESPISKRIFFVVDVSASMESEKRISKSLNFVMSVCQQPLDEYEIAVVVFNSDATRWAGVECESTDLKPCPKGWAKMPSETARKAAQKFLDGFPGKGTTNPVGALEIALREKRDALTVILITDGEFDSNPAAVKTIDQEQKARKDAGLDFAILPIYGVGSHAGEQQHLIDLAKKYRGGLWVEKKSLKLSETPKSPPFFRFTRPFK